MVLTPSEIGARAEREVSYALERAGWHVYLPVFAPHARVDLVAVRDERVERVQVKTSRVLGTRVPRLQQHGERPEGLPGRDRRVRRVLAGAASRLPVPVDHTPTRLCTLRLAPARSGQMKGTRLAADYELRPPG